MRRPRFQFRLLTIFALTALVGWGIVAVPYWLYSYPEERLLQEGRDEDLRISRLPPAERAKLQDDRYADQMGFGGPTPPARRELGVRVLLIGGASTAALAFYRFHRRKER